MARDPGLDSQQTQRPYVHACCPALDLAWSVGTGTLEYRSVRALEKDVITLAVMFPTLDCLPLSSHCLSCARLCHHVPIFYLAVNTVDIYGRTRCDRKLSGPAVLTELSRY